MTKDERAITQDELRRLLQYDPDTGEFTWLVARGRAAAGKVAGYKTLAGYICIIVYRKAYLAHRLAWLYMTGEWPTEIDHANRMGNDNRWRNLRLATRSQNEANKGMAKANTSGVRGVCWHRSNKRWVAQITLMKRKINLGSFATMEAAQAARQAKARELFGEFSGSENDNA